MKSFLSYCQQQWCQWQQKLQRCGYCQYAQPHQYGLCQACYRSLPLLSGDASMQSSVATEGLGVLSVQAVFAYHGLVRDLIVSVKYQQAFWAVPILGAALVDRARHWQRDACVLVPMPMHAKRRLQRGYNQAALLARWAAKRLQMPVDEQLLWRARHTPPQQALGRHQRINNLGDSMQARPCQWHDHPRVIVLDDVVTTGASMHAAKQALLQAGYASPGLWALAVATQGDKG